jgi:hypothetical protein
MEVFGMLNLKLLHRSNHPVGEKENQGFRIAKVFWAARSRSRRIPR